MTTLWDRLKRRASGHDPSEDDTPPDAQTAFSRESGGVDEGLGTQDQNSSTGTTPNDAPVGRASGDESGDPGESGADRRSGRDKDAHDGALRDE